MPASPFIIPPKPVQLRLSFDLAVWTVMRGWQLSDVQVLEPAAVAALKSMQTELRGSLCVCTARKMRGTPFCRECMETLRKARLTRQFNIFGRVATMGDGKWLETEHGLRSFFWHYDLCRDFLLNTRGLVVKPRATKRRAA